MEKYYSPTELESMLAEARTISEKNKILSEDFVWIGTFLRNGSSYLMDGFDSRGWRKRKTTIDKLDDYISRIDDLTTTNISKEKFPYNGGAFSRDCLFSAFPKIQIFHQNKNYDVVLRGYVGGETTSSSLSLLAREPEKKVMQDYFRKYFNPKEFKFYD